MKYTPLRIKDPEIRRSLKVLGALKGKTLMDMTEAALKKGIEELSKD